MPHPRRLALIAALAFLSSALGCMSASTGTTPPFRASPKRGGLGLTTRSAVEVAGELHARALEAAEGQYIGELDLQTTPIDNDAIPSVAASFGATHFRPIMSSDGERSYVLLFRIEPERWTILPDDLRPRSLSSPRPPGDRSIELVSQQR